MQVAIFPRNYIMNGIIILNWNNDYINSLNATQIFRCLKTDGMNDEKIITGNDEQEVWTQVTADLAGEEVLYYNVVIRQGNRDVILNIDIDPGGGFESGYETTSFTAELKGSTDFRFAIHKQGFLDEIGKFLGMQDVIIGYPELDKNVIIKTNDEARVKAIFPDEDIRLFFQSLEHDFTLGIMKHDDKRILELWIEEGITDADILRNVYHAFCTVLLLVDGTE